MKDTRNYAESLLPQTTSSKASATDKPSQVDALMARWSEGKTPGAAVIVIQDGRVLYEKGYGLADLRTRKPISPTTVFDIASVSKQFTAMAVMILVERGRLNYSDPLSKFFPEFPPYAQQVTIRHLLNQASGILDYTLQWGESKKLKGNAPRTSENVVRFLARQQRLEFNPGQRWEYSNSNYVLLAQIVSKVAGESLPQFVKKNIFQPLGMSDSFVYDETQTTTAAQATGYVSQESGFISAERNPENYAYGDGQVNSTIEDMYKWDLALYTSKLVKASTLAAAFTAGRLNDGTPISYGFGWGLGKYRGLHFVSHGGDTDGFVAQITRFPEQHFTVVLLSNFEQFTPAFAITNKIAGIYLADKVTLPVAVKLAPPLLRNYVGKYGLYDLVLKAPSKTTHYG
jgi:CubicO group peptidase (beta-lactamase class C family)